MAFVFWDGEECKDAGYCLFGASVDGQDPEYIQGLYLRTEDLLDFLLRISADNPKSSHIGFNFDYDVNQILRELSWRDLLTLKHKGKVVWHGYKIEHIPGKIFSVSKDGTRIRIDDCFSFFRCRFDEALRKWEVGDKDNLDEISDGKDNRDDFRYADIDSIRSYWAKEVTLGCALMNRIRRTCWEAGYRISKWYGPGALAAYSLAEHGVSSRMSATDSISLSAGLPVSIRTGTPQTIRDLSLYAYAGGWFERFKMGRHRGRVYTYDINSAYVYAMSLLPDLSTGHWRHYTFQDNEHANHLARTCRFGLFRTEWAAGNRGYVQACNGFPFPLFHREANGAIRRPVRTSGWYWNPEAECLSTVPYAKFTEAWIYEDDGTLPMEWVAEEFDKRLAYQACGDPSEKILKWALASYYGRLAQRTGWNERDLEAPRFHQIEWAGWITSKCRSMVYWAAIESARTGGLVSIDTDGIISTSPIDSSRLPNGEGNQLGRWKIEEYNELVYLQNGVYWLKQGDEWKEAKTRGIPKRKVKDPSLAIQCLESGEPVTLSRRKFIGYRAALHSDRSQWRRWVDDAVTLSFEDCGSRYHDSRLCRACKSGSGGPATCLHDLALRWNTSSESAPHRLPWLEDLEDVEHRYRDALFAEEM